MIDYIVDLNLHRRHLNESQRGMVAARVANMKQGERTDLVPMGTMLSNADAAKAVNVGKRTVARGKVVLAHGIQELVNKVDEGVMPLRRAECIARLPKPQQKEELAKPKRTCSGMVGGEIVASRP